MPSFDLNLLVLNAQVTLSRFGASSFHDKWRVITRQKTTPVYDDF
jgi:hypothetical protein